MKYGEVFREINQLIRVGKTRRRRQINRPPLNTKKSGFSYQKTVKIQLILLTLQGKFFDNLVELLKHDLLDPQKKVHDKKHL